MKQKLLAILLIATTTLSLVACGGGGNEESGKGSAEPQEKEYLSEEEIPSLFSNPDDYKGKYVKITGKIFTAPEVNGDKVALQIWQNPKESSNNCVVYCDKNDELASEVYVSVDGKIEGTFEGENMLGGTVTAPLIQADTVEVMSYIDAVVPTRQSAEPQNSVVEQNGISLKIDRVEFADAETRIYLTETNNSADKFSMYVYSIKLIQNGQQIEQDSSSMSSYEGNYPELSTDILPGASSSGVLVFPPINAEGFQLYAEGMSDNWETQFAPFTIDLTFTSN